MISALSSVGGIGSTSSITAPGPTQKAGATDFSKVLADVANSTVSALKGGESAAIGGVNGTMPVQDVVQSVMSAEQALQTAIAVRDKLVAAYQEISRMAI